MAKLKNSNFARFSAIEKAKLKASREIFAGKDSLLKPHNPEVKESKPIKIKLIVKK